MPDGQRGAVDSDENRAYDAIAANASPPTIRVVERVNDLVVETAIMRRFVEMIEHWDRWHILNTISFPWPWPPHHKPRIDEKYVVLAMLHQLHRHLFDAAGGTRPIEPFKPGQAWEWIAKPHMPSASYRWLLREFRQVGIPADAQPHVEKILADVLQDLEKRGLVDPVTPKTRKGELSAPDSPAGEIGTPSKRLRPCVLKAIQSYHAAVAANPDKSSDDSFYEWVRDVFPDYTAPTRPTWQRYVREAKAAGY